MTQVTVTTNSLEVFNSEFDKFCKKCEKLGFEKPAIVNDPVEYMRNTGETTPFGTPVKEKAWDVEVKYEIPVINGWKVVGNREDNNGMVILNTIDTESDLTSYNKSNTIHCEHCGTNHKRKKSVLIKNVNTGSILEVGTACLKDFVPVPFKSFLIFDAFKEYDEDNFWGSSDKVYAVDTVDVLTIASALIKKYGYTSKSKAYEFDTLSTAETVIEYFADKKAKNTEYFKFENLDNDKETAKTVIEYFKSLNPEEYYNNSYMTNCIKLLNAEYVEYKYFGYVCSTIAYNRMMEKEKEVNEKRNSEFVGNVKEKITGLKAVLVSRKITEGYYGTSQVLTFKDFDGNILTSFYSGKNDYTDYVGKDVTVNGTVAKHNLFNGTKQTILKRVNVK